MKVSLASDCICLELTPAEARNLLDELSNVRGGARLPNLRKVCALLDALFKRGSTPRKRDRTSKKESHVQSEE